MIHSIHSFFQPVAIMLCIAALCLGGCSGNDDWQIDTQAARGTISINGESPAGAIVTLVPTGEPIDVRKSKPWGKVLEDGTFTLRTYEEGDGAAIGTYDLTLVWRVDPTVMGSPDQLGGAYDEAHESQWEVTVVEGQEELSPIEIEGVRVVRGSGRPMAPPEEPPQRR